MITTGLAFLTGVLCVLITTITATASVPIAISATLIAHNTDGTQEVREEKIKRKYCEVGAPFPIPDIAGYVPDMTDIPKLVTPAMGSSQHKITYNALAAKVIVYYVDQTKHTELQSPLVLDKGTIDGHYQISPPQIKDYELVTAAKLNGSITKTKQIITLEFKNKVKQPEKEPEQPEESKPDNPDQPGSDSILDKPNQEEFLKVTVQQLTDTGRHIKQELKQLSKKQLNDLLKLQWTITGYQFKNCQYEEASQTLRVIYHPCSINVTVLAKDPLDNQLASEQVTGEFGSTLTVVAPSVEGYLAKIPVQTVKINSLNPEEVVFIYESEATTKPTGKPTESELTVSEPTTPEADQNEVQDLPVSDNKVEQVNQAKQPQETQAAVKFINPKRSREPNNPQVLKRSTKKLPQTSEAAVGWSLTVLGVLGLAGIGWLKLKSKQK